MKILKLSLLSLFIFSLFSISSCKNEEGEGGQASITGKIWIKRYNTFGTLVIGEFAGAYEDVYIVYGDDETYGDRVETNPDGVYEFKYLRPGKYTIYAYSTGPSLSVTRVAEQVEVDITKKKQTVDAGTIEITQ